MALGLNDGSMIVKSKELQNEEKEIDEEDKMFKMFEPTMVSTSKNYKYFYRGQYEVKPDSSDLTTAA